jgi:hypothetical protein
MKQHAWRPWTAKCTKCGHKAQAPEGWRWMEMECDAGWWVTSLYGAFCPSCAPAQRAAERGEPIDPRALA